MTAFIGRRELITLLGGAATWPLTARTQAIACTDGTAFVQAAPQQQTNEVARMMTMLLFQARMNACPV